MASGLPDYFRGVDVAYQNLSEMITRPKYGGALMESGSETLVPDGWATLDLIIGKGMLYGATIWLDHTSSQANSYLDVLLDGTSLNNISFLRLNDYGIAKPRSSIITINKYDPVDHIYSVGLSYGLTFESYLMLIYYEEHNTNPTVHYRLVYALI